MLCCWWYWKCMSCRRWWRSIHRDAIQIQISFAVPFPRTSFHVMRFQAPFLNWIMQACVGRNSLLEVSHLLCTLPPDWQGVSLSSFSKASSFQALYSNHLSVYCICLAISSSLGEIVVTSCCLLHVETATCGLSLSVYTKIKSKFPNTCNESIQLQVQIWMALTRFAWICMLLCHPWQPMLLVQ